MHIVLKYLFSEIYMKLECSKVEEFSESTCYILTVSLNNIADNPDVFLLPPKVKRNKWFHSSMCRKSLKMVTEHLRIRTC